LENLRCKILFNEKCKILFDIHSINAKQSTIIVDKQPVQRFWQINNFNGIGKKSYEKLFRYYYQLAKGKKRELVQMAFEI
jgi:hypothetical protein